MRMTITSTPTIELLDGVPCRVWDGVTDRAVRVSVYVAAVRIDSPSDSDCAELERELIVQFPPEIRPV